MVPKLKEHQAILNTARVGTPLARIAGSGGREGRRLREIANRGGRRASFYSMLLSESQKNMFMTVILASVLDRAASSRGDEEA